jgi:hypothetical protein
VNRLKSRMAPIAPLPQRSGTVGSARYHFVALTFSAYGAVILSFLGGIQRGSAIAVDNVSLPRLGLSVTLSLIAWVVLLLPLSTWLIPVNWFVCLRLDGRSSRQPVRRGVCLVPAVALASHFGYYHVVVARHLAVLAGD